MALTPFSAMIFTNRVAFSHVCDLEWSPCGMINEKQWIWKVLVWASENFGSVWPACGKFRFWASGGSGLTRPLVRNRHPPPWMLPPPTSSLEALPPRPPHQATSGASGNDVLGLCRKYSLLSLFYSKSRLKKPELKLELRAMKVSWWNHSFAS